MVQPGQHSVVYIGLVVFTLLVLVVDVVIYYLSVAKVAGFDGWNYNANETFKVFPPGIEHSKAGTVYQFAIQMCIMAVITLRPVSKICGSASTGEDAVYVYQTPHGVPKLTLASFVVGLLLEIIWLYVFSFHHYWAAFPIALLSTAAFAFGFLIYLVRVPNSMSFFKPSEPNWCRDYRGTVSMAVNGTAAYATWMLQISLMNFGYALGRDGSGMYTGLLVALILLLFFVLLCLAAEFVVFPQFSCYVFSHHLVILIFAILSFVSNLYPSTATFIIAVLIAILSLVALILKVVFCCLGERFRRGTLHRPCAEVHAIKNPTDAEQI